MPNRVAYMPLNTYPEAATDPAILAAVRFAASLGCALHVSTYAVDIPSVSSPLGGFLVNVESMARAAEERSMEECARLKALIEGAVGATSSVQFLNRRVLLGAALDDAATEARYFDLALLPWDAEAALAESMAQTLVFGAGVPVIMVPKTALAGSVDHIAIAWDESHVAARALRDALPLLDAGGRVSVLTVQDEKSLGNADIAQTLAASLAVRGHAAKAIDIHLGGRALAEALQDEALAQGAKLLVMGGFGHTRLRDFILGGATKGVLHDLRMPVLLSH